MSTIQDAYWNALLADATYAFEVSDDSVSGEELIELLKIRMTEPVATYIANNFSMVTHIETDDTFGSGFDATVWRRADGKLYVSMKGTEGPQDFLSDRELTFSGAAGHQIRDMINWWLRITTPENEMAREIVFEVDSEGVILPNYVITTSSSPGLGLISAAELAAGVEVNGHSLGGHLATAFTRLFGVQANVTHTTTFNSAGFKDSEPAFQSLEDLLGDGYGLGRFPNEAEQTNFFSENGINVTTNTFWFEQIGQRVGVFNEEGTGFPNHYMYKLTDTLALVNVLATLDASMSFSKANDFISAASTEMAGSLEGVLDGVRRMLLGEVSPTPVGDESGSAVSRVLYHQNISQLVSGSVFIALQGKLNFIWPATSGESARTDFGQFLALQYLTSFSLEVTDADALALLKSANSLLAQQWEADQALTPEQRARGEGNFSEAYLQDRANMLSWLIKDRLLPDNQQLTDHQAKDGFDYQDLASGQEVLVLPDPFVAFQPLVHRVYFGSEDVDTLEGHKGNDRLYGGGGTDVLKGEAGHDYLEGGTGNDTLIGGKGNDTLVGGADNDRYEFSEGDGNDLVIDSDGLGELWIDGVRYTKAQQLAEQADSWVSGEVKFIRSGADLRVLYGDGDSILIKDFKDGVLGLKLEQYKKPNVSPSGGSSAISGTNYSDDITDTAGNDWIQTFAGNDRVNYAYGRKGGNDYIDLGEGDDQAFSGSGRDTLIGGAGADRLFGGDGDDILFAHLPGNEGPGNVVANGITGDWLDGGTGNDTLIGSGGADGLFGGAGSDLIVAGDGDDIVAADGITSNLMPGLFLSITQVSIGKDFVRVPFVSGLVGFPVGDSASGNDTIFAGAGNDWVDGYKGDDYIEGNQGND